MTADAEVRTHYTHGSLFDAIAAALADEGIDIHTASVEDLAPLDHFHGRGLQATEELLGGLSLSAADRVLDVGSGIGGPARYVVQRFGCGVTGIDLTDEFCAVARRLNEIVGLADRIVIEVGSATALPFEDDSFDAAFSQNVSMNVSDKHRFYGEIHRVVRPGGAVCLAEIALGQTGAPIYPVPWSSDGANSFLQAPEEALAVLEEVGFEILSWRDLTDQVIETNQAMRARIAREGPPRLGPHILMGEGAREKMRNSAQNVEEGRTRPIDILCRKPAG